MSDVMEYKCTACGGTMEFDSDIQKLKCPYCGTEMTADEYEQQCESKQEKNAETSENKTTVWEAAGTGEWAEGEGEDMSVYSCQSCGGEIVADDTTGATTCPYCGNRVAMKSKFSGDLKPDYIIPFKLNKQAAIDAYKNHLKGKSFLPKVFSQENHIEEIKGIYVPFWLLKATANGHIVYRAEKIRKWEKGDTEYTEHEVFRVERAGSMNYELVPADASEKMDDKLMESIEPFDFSQAEPFKSAYLAGYVADRYDVDKERMGRRMTMRIQDSVQEALLATVNSGYTNYYKESSNINLADTKYSYALYPVWILNTKWKDEKYVFAMNGQTGKLVGDLPADESAYTKFIAIRGAIFAVIIYALMWLYTLL